MNSIQTPKPLQGTWLDIAHPSPREGVYWNRRTLAFSDSDWRNLVRHLADDFDLEYLIILGVAIHHGMYLYPSTVKGRDGGIAPRFPISCQDPVKAILDASAEFGLKVFVGLGAYPGVESTQMPLGDEISPSAKWAATVAADLLDQYGHLSSFYGLYTAAELYYHPATGLIPPEQVEWSARFCEEVRKVAPDKKILTSPFHPWQIVEKNSDLEAVGRQIDALGVDYFAPQDGVGADRPGTPRPASRAIEAFRRLNQACQGCRTELWGNVETFRFENDILFQPLLPGPWARIEEQIRGVSPFVNKLLCYQIPGLLTSQKLFPRLGEPETESLYQDYQRFRRSLAG